MKTPYTLAAFIGLSICSTANAATIAVGGGASGKYSIYLIGGADNGNFNVVKLTAQPNVGAAFLNLSSGARKTAADRNTFRTRQLDADPLDGGLGWAFTVAETAADRLRFTVGPLSGNITTANEPGGRLFLGNYVLSPDGYSRIKVTLLNASGAVVFSQTIDAPLTGPGQPTPVFPDLPEPASRAMAAIGLLGLNAFRGRRLSQDRRLTVRASKT